MSTQRDLKAAWNAFRNRIASGRRLSNWTAMTFALVSVMSAVTPASGAVVAMVSGKADLYAVGLAANASCCAGDSAPLDTPVLAPLTFVTGEFLTFVSTGGATRAPAQDPASFTAEGDTSAFYNMPTTFSGTGISGATGVYLQGLAGVFVADANPTTAPAPYGGGVASPMLKPGLGQIFFIGDGLTGIGSGGVQQFYVPTGATRLFLGVVDLGGNYDNGGVITTTITASATTAAPSGVPEPASWALMLGGLGVLGGRFRRRRTSVRRG